MFQGLSWLFAEHDMWLAAALVGIVCFSAGLATMHLVRRRQRQHSLVPQAVDLMTHSEDKLRKQNLLLDTALNNMSLGLCMFDAEARLVICNRRYLEMYGLSPDVVKPGCSLLELLHHRTALGSFSADPEQYTDNLRREIALGSTNKTMVKSCDGHVVAVLNQPMPGGGWVATHEDISELARAEEELRRTRTFLDNVIEHLPIMITVKEAREQRYMLVNRAAAALFEVPRAKMLGKQAHDLFPEAEADFFVARDHEALRSRGPAVVAEHVVNTPGNGARVLITKKLPILASDGEPQYLLSLSEDITDRKRAEDRIAHMARHDTLTDLPNRSAFNVRFAAMLERAAGQDEPFALLCIDLDRFKEVNDVLGHAAGDAALREVAKRLQIAAEGAFLARLGSDEFIMMVAGGIQPATAAVLADRVQASVAEELEIAGRQLRVGLSIGVAIYPTDGTDATALLANADAALDRAKQESRGSVRFFEADMDLRLRERRALQHDLRSSIDRGELTLHYQPQARIDGGIIGFEALMRWQHPTRGRVSPGMFIPLAEESGLIVEMGEWVLREACREAASWPQPLQIAVNLSPVQFRVGDLAALVHAVLIETGLAPSRLELEITEGALIDDFSRAVSILRRLKGLGVRIAMDDFGTGYSSLSYLQSFPFDKIKIDQTFISNLERNPQSAAIVRAVIGLARGLDLPVIAEGVETKDQLAFLAHEACDQVQGYFIGRPEPIENYAEMVGRPMPRAAKTG